MADYLVYWKTFWDDNPNGDHTPDFDYGTKQPFWNNVGKGDSLWCVTRGGGNAPNEWRLVQRLVVQDKYLAADHEWPNRFRGDPLLSESYQVSSQTDLAPLLQGVELDGPVINAHGAAIGNAIQTARELTENGHASLVAYARGLKRIAISPTALEQVIGVSDDDLTRRLSPSGAGFGDPETNRKVERAAVSATTRHYESQGWVVKSVEAENRGYDLLCEKVGDEIHVEVKGVQGTEAAFIITANEERAARTDVDFVLCVVTSALIGPTLNFYDAASFVQDFELSPLAYRAILRK